MLAAKDSTVFDRAYGTRTNYPIIDSYVHVLRKQKNLYSHLNARNIYLVVFKVNQLMPLENFLPRLMVAPLVEKLLTLSLILEMARESSRSSR